MRGAARCRRGGHDGRQHTRDGLHLLEFFLVDSPAHPGEYFPRTSGMRFRYDPSRLKFDVVTVSR